MKFEIAEHVYEDNDPTKKEVHATTSPNSITNSITIKISKQILIGGTGMSQTNIENAKTILHECTHAYLFTKANNPMWVWICENVKYHVSYRIMNSMI